MTDDTAESLKTTILLSLLFLGWLVGPGLAAYGIWGWWWAIPVNVACVSILVLGFWRDARAQKS